MPTSDITAPVLRDDSQTSTQNAPPEYQDRWNASGGALAAGDAVRIDISDTAYGLGVSIAKTVTTDQASFYGVCAEAIADDAKGKVITHGIAEGCAVESGVAAGDQLMPSATTAGRLDTAVPEVNYAQISGGAAGAHTVTGIRAATDSLISVVEEDGTSGISTDLTSEFSISNDDEITNTTTATTGDLLLVTWHRPIRKVAMALEAASSNAADVFVY